MTVPLHMPHLNGVGEFLVPRCCCGWRGSNYHKTRIGEQAAMSAAMAHAGLNNRYRVSALVATPSYAFEVSSDVS